MVLGDPDIQFPVCGNSVGVIGVCCEDLKLAALVEIPD